MEAEVMASMMDGSQLEATGAALEAAVHPMLLVALEMMPVVGRMEGIMSEGPLDTMTVAEETSRELSLVLPSEGHHPPMRDEPLLRWVSSWHPSSKIFTLDDAVEGMEREKLSKGFMTMLEALN